MISRLVSVFELFMILNRGVVASLETGNEKRPQAKQHSSEFVASYRVRLALVQIIELHLKEPFSG